MERSGLFYVRFMDDILVLAPTRWRLRKAVKAVNEVLGSLWLLKHPDKTFMPAFKLAYPLKQPADSQPVKDDVSARDHHQPGTDGLDVG